MNITLPNGKKIRNIPDDTPKLEIAQKAIAAGLATAEDFGGFVPEPWQQNETPGAGINPIAGNAQQLLQGATFGGADELQAGIGALTTLGQTDMPFLERYKAIRDQLRQEKQQFIDQEGAAAYVPEFIGGAVTGLGGLAKGTTLAGKAGIGALEGAIGGAGYADAENLISPETAAYSAGGAALGGGLGVALPLAGRVAGKAVRAVGGKIRGAMPNTKLPDLGGDVTPKKPVPMAQSVAQEVAEETIDGNPPNIAAQYLRRGDKLVKDPLYPVAQQQGIRDGTVNAIKTMNPADRNKSKIMLNMFERAKANDLYDERPAKMVGDTLLERVKFVGKKRAQFGQQLNAFANKRLRGQPIEIEGVMRRFQDALEESGAQIKTTDSGRTIIDFKGSALPPRDRKPIREVFDYFMANTERAPLDARGAHVFKQAIDNNIPWDATNKMTSGGERILKELRHGINEQLQTTFDGYAQINSKLAETIDAMSSVMDATKIKVDINSPEAADALGQEARKLFTNYKSRPQLSQAIDKIESAAATHGLKSNESIKAQAAFVNGMEDLFGPQAKAGFEGLTERGGRRAIEASATGGKSELLREAGSKIAEAASPVSDEARFKVLRQLLSR